MRVSVTNRAKVISTERNREILLFPYFRLTTRREREFSRSDESDQCVLGLDGVNVRPSYHACAPPRITADAISKKCQRINPHHHKYATSCRERTILSKERCPYDRRICISWKLLPVIPDRSRLIARDRCGMAFHRPL